MLKYSILLGDNLDELKKIPDGFFQSCVTSPPYWGLRNYDSEGQLGLEKNPEEYVKKIVLLFREIRRVLKDDGTVWLNIGDSYCGTGHKKNYQDPKYDKGRNGQSYALNNKIDGIKSKDLVGIPWMVAFALRNDGWYLRQDIIWAKTNPMPECLSPDTKIFIKYNGKILRRKLDYLWKNRKNLKDIKILSSLGWKNVKNIWETTKEVYEVNLSNIEKIYSSGDHKFPVCNDDKREKTQDKKVKDIRNKNDRLTYFSIDKFIDSEKTHIDIVDIVISEKEKELYIN